LKRGLGWSKKGGGELVEGKDQIPELEAVTEKGDSGTGQIKSRVRDFS